MRLLLLGHNGQLGSDIKRICEGRSDIELIAVGRDIVDVSRSEMIAAALSGRPFDVLVNCTSYHKTDEAERNASVAFAVNAHAVREMAKICRARKAKFFHISTDYVFDGTKTAPYTETDCARPINVYGASKAMGEVLAGLEHDRLYVLRVASLFGIAGASGKGGNFVETMLRLAREKGEVRVVDDILMSPTGTADVARMILRLIDRDAPAGIYHAVNSGQASWYEFAQAIVGRAGIPARVEPIKSRDFPSAALRPPYSVLSNAKMSSIVGAIPHWSEALGRYLLAKDHAKPAEAAVT